MRYSIWSEGYRATGESSVASKLAEDIEANSFLEACQKWVDRSGERKAYFDIVDGKPHFWGCQLFDNEEDARVNFG